MDRGTCTVFLGDALCEAVRVSWHEAWWEVVANSGKGNGTGKGTGEEGSTATAASEGTTEAVTTSQGVSVAMIALRL